MPSCFSTHLLAFTLHLLSPITQSPSNYSQKRHCSICQTDLALKVPPHLALSKLMTCGYLYHH